MRICALAACLFLLQPLVVRGQDTERNLLLDADHDSVVYLEQNWTHEESNWFYNVPQGSRLFPYDWFINLEQPNSSEKFIEASNVLKYGYLARKPSEDNPDGLPVGFVKDAEYDDGTSAVGLTCAACHTGRISHAGKLYVIDGGPALGDLERLMKDMVEAIDQTVTDDEKFARFAKAILRRASRGEENLLRDSLRQVAEQRAGYNQRNFSQAGRARFGHGRIDAFGAIFNEVSATFLGVPANARPANAPVNYPCLWDAPQHDRVQWNGSAENRTSDLGVVLFGTKEVGALGRNTGEVLGVFGHTDINDHELLIPRKYASTAKKINLLAIEKSLRSLWSPEWPTAFGAIDDARRDRGESLYRDNCLECHAMIDRDSPTRTVTAKMAHVGTDPTLLANFTRTGETGKLRGRRKTILGLERFDAKAPVALILKHVVERAILKSKIRKFRQLLARSKSDLDELSPGFQSTAIVQVGGKEIAVSVDALSESEGSVQVFGKEADLLQLAQEMIADDGLAAPTDAEAPVSFGRLGDRLKDRLKMVGIDDNEVPSSAEIPNASVRLAYKARPLNGVWATAPYLHNGSVPTLEELLKPADERIKKFHVGSIVFDPAAVGFVNDPDYPLFDTSLTGNSNAGHEYGGNLTDEERRDLIEYLKSL